MPIDSSIYGQLDTGIPQRIVDSLDPMLEQQRQAKLADLLYQQQAKPLQLEVLRQTIGDASIDRGLKRAHMDEYAASAAERKAKTQKLQEMFDLGKQISLLPEGHPDKPGLILKYRMLADPTQVFDPAKVNKPLIEHNFSVGDNQVQPHISLDNGITWTPVPGSKPSAKFAKQVGTTVQMPEPSVMAIDPVTQQPVFVSRREAIEKRLRPAGLDAGTQGAIANAKATGQATAAATTLSEKDKTSAVKALKAAGYDPEAGTDKVSELLDQATGGSIGQGVDWLAGTANITLNGKAANDSLKTLANTIVMDMMGGKLGAGISNADREFIVGQLGNVADASQPVGARKAAWNTAKARLVSVGVPMGGGGQPAAPVAPAPSLVSQIPIGVAPKIPTNSADHQETVFNARKAIAKNPAVRDAVIAKMKAGGYDTSGL